MPGKVKVKVLAGRNLPVMDRGSDTTDAFVEIKFGSVTHKTDVCRKSLNPHWNNSDWYRFEVDDSELQDEPLQLRLMDHDTYSANDAIGKVVVSLAPLLAREPTNTSHRPHHHSGTIMSGWIPVFDTMHGIRGELNIIVKVELFSDFNKFRQSSCGVQFFHCPMIPPGYQASVVHGFVEELIVNADPEYQWIDKIRTPRASNEARQVAFVKLSNQVQRRVGLKAAELGANAVVGYMQSFDLEGEAGVVARAVGTAVTIVRTFAPQPSLACSQQKEEKASPKHTRAESYGGKDGGTPAQAGSGGNTTISPPSGGNVQTSTAATTVPIGMHRRSSDSDLSITPKGGSLTMTSTAGGAILRPSMNPNNLDMLDYPFLTMTEFPPGFIIHLGGAVNARSVKLIDGGSSEGNSRAAWWAELRTELRAHARALRCTAVLGYSESASICDDICVMSVSGTAAVINLEPASFAHIPTAPFNAMNVSGSNSRVLGRADSESESTNRREVPIVPEVAERETETNSDASNQQLPKPGCSLAHVPYNHQTMPYQANVDKCSLCKRSRVPKLLICSIELPQSLAVTGRGCLISAAAARIRRAPPNGEPGARDISDQLPFLEYELHRLLIAKLRVHGMNAIFGVKTTIAAGERMVVALVTGTGVFISALPPPRAPALRGAGAGGESSNNDTLVELQRALDDALAANRAVYELDSTASALPSYDSDEDLPSLDLAGDKEACILEVDDAEDVEMARSLTEPRAPKGIHAVTTQSVPGLPVRAVGSGSGLPHTFTQLWRARLPQPNAGAATAVARHVHRLLQSVYYKLRRMTPCAVCNLKFQLVLPEVDEIQLLVTGVAISVADSLPLSAPPAERPEALSPRPEETSEMIFSLDEEEGGRDAGDRSGAGLNKSTGDGRNLAGLVQNAARACGVSLTPLALVEGARSQRPVSALRLLFVRETTSVRELGGVSGFLHTFITEVLAVVRAYTTALGGNALASFYITELMLQDNPHKNQGQCLLSVGGDVVQVTY